MSMDDFENCMVGEYNADKEAVEFIIKIYQLGSEDAIKVLKDNWEKIAAAAAIIGAIAKYGGESALVKYFQKIFSAAGAAVVELLVAAVLGLGVAAIGLAVIAAGSCLSRIDQ